MHIAPSDFGRMRPADFSVALNVYNESATAKSEWDAELVRALAWRIIVPWLKTKPKDLHSFWPLPWDVKSGRMPQMTQEERLASINNFLKKIRDGIEEKPES